MTTATASVPRIVWEAIRAKPARQRTLIAASALLWAAAVVAFAVSVFLGDRSLNQLSFPLMSIFWMTGFGLTNVGGLVGPRWTHQTAPLLSATTGDAIQPPDPTVVAVPVLAAVGAACLGFAGAMLLAQAYAGPATLNFSHPIVWGAAFSGILLFLLGAGLAMATRSTIHVTRWASQRAAAIATSRADVERATFMALQARLNPEFLQNTLNAVSTLAASDPRRAEKVVERLSSFLRRSMRRSGRLFTTVEDETAFICEYLDVEEARLGFRLRTAWHIEAVTRDLKVPTGCLLPLVEEAIAQAVEPREAGAQIEIATTLDEPGRQLALSIEDWGPGGVSDRKETPAVAAIRKRLSDEYGLDLRYEIEPSPYGRKVVITLPATPFESTATPEVQR